MRDCRKSLCLVVLLVAILLAGVLPGCADNDKETTPTPSPSDTQATSPTEATAETPAEVTEESTLLPGTPISKDNPTIIQSISNIVGEGEASFLQGVKYGTLRLAINGTLPVNESKFCLGGFETIEISPNLSIPTKVFTEISIDKLSSFLIIEGTITSQLQLETVTIDGKEYTVLKDPPVIDSLDFIGVVLEIPIDAEDAESIVSGPDGATLKKVENGFLLLEGEAYLVD